MAEIRSEDVAVFLGRATRHIPRGGHIPCIKLPSDARDLSPFDPPPSYKITKITLLTDCPEDHGPQVLVKIQL